MLRVIVVDDEVEARDKMIRAINKAESGISIIGVASDGVAAYELIVEKKPDIVLIDIEMPGMSGLDVIRKVHETGILVVFIIISSYSDFYYAQEAISLGVEDYLLKPFMPNEICTSIFRAAKHIRMLKLMPYFDEASENDGEVAPYLPENIMLDYPFKLEKKLIHSVISGEKESVREGLREFFKQVEENNPKASLIKHCYIALYIELFHIAQERNIRLDMFNANISHLTVVDKKTTQDVLAELCYQLSSQFSQGKASTAVAMRAMRYIEEHYAEEITLAVVAEKIFVSPSYLSGLFMRTMNMHFTDYIQYIRVRAAQRIMQEQAHLKNYEIAERVGFNSAKYFSTVFKKVTNMSITQYRNHLGENTEKRMGEGRNSDPMEIEFKR